MQLKASEKKKVIMSLRQQQWLELKLAQECVKLYFALYAESILIEMSYGFDKVLLARTKSDRARENANSYSSPAHMSLRFIMKIFLFFAVFVFVVFFLHCKRNRRPKLRRNFQPRHWRET